MLLELAQQTELSAAVSTDVRPGITRQLRRHGSTSRWLSVIFSRRRGQIYTPAYHHSTSPTRLSHRSRYHTSAFPTSTKFFDLEVLNLRITDIMAFMDC